MPLLDGSQVNAFLLCPERQSLTDDPAVIVSALQADPAEVGEPNSRQPEAGVGECLVLCRGGCRRHLADAFDITLSRKYGSVCLTQEANFFPCSKMFCAVLTTHIPRDLESFVKP